MTKLPDRGWPGILRVATDRDAAAVRKLIGGCFAEYEGCVLDSEGIDAWMAAPASTYADKGGQFWVLAEPDTAALMACVGWGPDRPGRIELKNLYVSSSARRRGLGRRLVALIEAAADEQDAEEVILWSDTRFLDAHRLYAGLGYRRTGAQRALLDPSDSIEYEFVKPL
ncbi:MAG: GNAT family N-acetyltransferase [Geodermatophilaceae bacterium]